MIVEIQKGLSARGDEAVIDAGGCAVIPGLHDHHIHLNATAAARSSIQCGPPAIQNADQLAAALHNAPGAEWIRGVGYHQSVAGEIDRAWLDVHGPDRPIRIQHRSGRLWIVNSLALSRLGTAAPKDGRLLDSDPCIAKALGVFPPDLAPVVSDLLSWGVTGVTDTTHTSQLKDASTLADRTGPLRLLAMGDASMDAAFAGNSLIGPRKFHFHDHDLPALDELVKSVRAAHLCGRPAAFHCVTLAELMLALAALEDAGAINGDRIEHGAMASDAAMIWMAQMGVPVVTQLGFLNERLPAYETDVPSTDKTMLWRHQGYLNHEVALAAGSDSPFGDLNPWKAMARAVKRPVGFGVDEALAPEDALAGYLKPAEDVSSDPRRLCVGAPADIAILDRNWETAKQDLSLVQIAHTILDGLIAYSKMSSTNPH